MKEEILKIWEEYKDTVKEYNDKSHERLEYDFVDFMVFLEVGRLKNGYRKVKNI